MYRCESDRYDPGGEGTYKDLDDFLEMVEWCFDPPVADELRDSLILCKNGEYRTTDGELILTELTG